ncbi:MAG TPA: hypothetical protein HA224_02630 [Nanoarchaeota archaeon]|nr:hypothetical protein [Nanoarchaeota archaeon]
MGVGRAILGALTCGTSLKSLTDIVNHADPGWFPIAAGASAAAYGWSEGRLGLGVSVYCSIQFVNQVANHGDIFWYTIGAIAGVIIYSLPDNERVQTIVKRVTDSGGWGRGADKPAPPHPPAPYPLSPTHSGGASGMPKPLVIVRQRHEEKIP